MALCVNCFQGRNDVEMGAGLTVCLDRMKKQNVQAESSYVVTSSGDSVETPYGWATALCVLGQPVEGQRPHSPLGRGRRTVPLGLVGSRRWPPVNAVNSTMTWQHVGTHPVKEMT